MFLNYYITEEGVFLTPPPELMEFLEQIPLTQRNRAFPFIVWSLSQEQCQTLMRLMWGFQLWINLPGSQKMTDPEYQEFDQGEIPTETGNDGVTIHVITGVTARGTT